MPCVLGRQQIDNVVVVSEPSLSFVRRRCERVLVLWYEERSLPLFPEETVLWYEGLVALFPEETVQEEVEEETLEELLEE